MTSKSVLTTTFQLGTFRLPIRLYKTTDSVGLSGQLFHEGCGGKIRQWKTCENHPNIEDPATFSGIQIGNKIVKLTKEVREQLLDGECEFEAVSAHRLSALPSLIADQEMSLLEPLRMVPEKYFETPYASLLERLRIRKQFLLARHSRNQMRRYGILLHSGLFIPVRYEEEVREEPNIKFLPDRSINKQINEELDRLSVDEFEAPSCSDLNNKMQTWFTDNALGRNIVAYTYIVEPIDA